MEAAPKAAPAGDIDLASIMATPGVEAMFNRMIEAKLLEMSNTAPVSGGIDPLQREFFERLMAQMQQTSDRDTGRVTLPPEVLASQEQNRLKMGGLIMERRAAIDEAIRVGRDDTEEWPSYQVLDKIFLKDYIVDPWQMNVVTRESEPTILYWDGVPNKAMKPLNDHAQQIHDAFIGAICNTKLSAAARPVDLWITDSGICMRGQPPVSGRRRLAKTDGTDVEQGLLSLDAYRAKHGIVGHTNPGASHIKILGTIHPPATAGARDPNYSMPPAHRVSGAR